MARAPGDPLPGLTSAELTRFEQGKGWMERKWTEEESLGLVEALPDSESARDTRSRGEDIFHALGCPSCHVPTMQTGAGASEALEGKTIHLYSDMLLHDLGPQVTDICGPTATPSEVMTARLMGLRFRQVLLHNGRAPDVNRAILMHGGEATVARTAYEDLTAEARGYLMRFLDLL